MLWFRLILLALFFLYPGAVFAQVLELSGHGKIGYTDNENQKDISFNDSSWTNVSFLDDINNKTIRAKIFWLRIPFKPAVSFTPYQNIGMIFSGLGGKYSVYFNGKLIGQGNSILSSGKVYSISAGDFKKNGNMLALRISNEGFNTALGVFGKIYYGSLDNIIHYRYQVNSIYLAVSLLFFILGLLIFFAYRKSIRNYFTLFLGVSITTIAVYIFLKSFTGATLFSNLKYYVKISEFLYFIILPSTLMFLNRFYKVGFNKLDIVYFCLLAPCVFFLLFNSQPAYLKYLYAAVVVINLIPAIFYSMVAFRRILKNDGSGYFFISGFFVAYLLIIISFFVKRNIFFYNIAHLTSFALLFSAGFFYYYYSLHTDLVENKYLLENRLFESSVIVDDKNESYVDLGEKMQLLENIFSNSIELARKTLQQFSAEMPYREDLDFNVVSFTSKKLSGDYFKVIPLKDGLRFVLIDFPGDEIGALVLNLVIEYEMKSNYKLKSPATILKKMNENIEFYNFNVLLSLIIFDIFPEDKKLKMCSAGFPEICVIRDDGIHVLDTGGVPIGLDRFNYVDIEYDLMSQDEIVVFTDGIMHQIRKMSDQTFSDYIKNYEGSDLFANLSAIAEENKNLLLDDVTMVNIKIM